jgi:hypothetical protein
VQKISFDALFLSVSGNPNTAPAARAAVTPGTTSNEISALRNAAISSPARPKHQRVPTLEPNHRIPRTRRFDHQLINPRLRNLGSLKPLSHARHKRTPMHKSEHFVRHKVIMKHNICRLQQSHSTYRQQLRITRP